jgi:hypothetical protein
MPLAEQIAVLGNIGEFLGSILVFVTLIYLAIQTRSINKQSQAEARYAFVDAMADINVAIGSSKQVASAFRRGLESIENLDEDERMQFYMFVGQYANSWAVMYQLHQDRMLPDAQWQIIRNDIISILSSVGGKAFWEAAGNAAFDPGFVQWVNEELSAGDRPYDMSGMTK